MAAGSTAHAPFQGLPLDFLRVRPSLHRERPVRFFFILCVSSSLRRLIYVRAYRCALWAVRGACRDRGAVVLCILTQCTVMFEKRGVDV